MELWETAEQYAREIAPDDDELRRLLCEAFMAGAKEAFTLAE